MKNYSLFFPIYGVTLDKAIRRELQIERVTFISSNKIPYVRRRLGLKYPVSEYDKKSVWRKAPLFSEADTYAVVRTKRDPDDKKVAKERRLVQEALWILASSFIGRSERGRYDLSIRPLLSGRLYETWMIFDNESGAGKSNLSRLTPVWNYHLDRQWKSFMRRYAFPTLCRILNGEVRIRRSWRQTLRRAAILAGQGALSRSVHDGFIRSMIAIETLLAQRGDKFPEVLIERLMSFFGWLTRDNREFWEHSIRRLYQLRCSYVHDGEAGDIEGLDVYYADHLLQNLLMNICENPRIFSSKKDVISFASELQAKRVLGLPLRPNTLRLHFIGNFPPSESEIKRINDVSRWAW